MPARLLDMPGFATRFATVTGRRCVRSGPPLVIMSLNRSIYDTQSHAQGSVQIAGCQGQPARPGPIGSAGSHQQTQEPG